MSMLLYIEGLDKAGKTTFVNRLSDDLGWPVYRKCPPSNLPLQEHHSFFKGVAYALLELHNIFSFNSIIDRSFVSDWVYTNRSGAVKPFSIWNEWEERHSSLDGVAICYVSVPAEIILERLERDSDPYMDASEIERFQELYEYYLENTIIPVWRISGTSSSSEHDAIIGDMRRRLISKPSTK